MSELLTEEDIELFKQEIREKLIPGLSGIETHVKREPLRAWIRKLDLNYVQLEVSVYGFLVSTHSNRIETVTSIKSPDEQLLYFMRNITFHLEKPTIEIFDLTNIVLKEEVLKRFNSNNELKIGFDCKQGNYYLNDKYYIGNRTELTL